VMLALGRFYKDSEMAALMACGVGPKRLYRSLMAVAVIVVALLAWFSLDLGPWAARQTLDIKRTAQQEAEVGALEPGRFRSIDQDNAVFYAEGVDADEVWTNVFLERRVENGVELATADRGEIKTDAQGGRTVVLYDGKRYEGTPGQVDFRITSFEEHGIPIQLKEPEVDTDEREQRLTQDLWGSSDLLDRTELQWRLSVPISAFILTILAVPLSRTSPRQGRYGKIGFGILIYLIYSNLLGAARVWTEQETLPVQLGVWWVHLLLLALAGVLLIQQNGLLWLFDKSNRELTR
ncbi:MAG: LPS export ABC transporter permease LptF, partial [Pseudomonadota bacterium]